MGYGTSPIAVSWLRSAGAGQKTSSIVRVFGAEVPVVEIPVVEVPVVDELVLVEVLEELFVPERKM